MAIPGLKPDLQIRGKVKTGEVRKSNRTGREYPASTDYFLCPDDPEFALTFGEKPQSLVIEPAFATPDEFFSTGLEWWTKQRNGSNFLACYTKDGGDSPVALRAMGYMEPDNKLVGDPDDRVGQNRCRIACPFRDCVHLKNKDCKPMGRLTFYAVAGDERLGPYQLDTKSWNSVEALEGFLASVDQFGVASRFVLSVAFHTQGDQKFPVLSMEEYTDLDINTPADVQEADAVIALANDQERLGARQALANYLDATRPGWRDEPALIERMKEIGAVQAVANILSEHLDDPSEPGETL